jgi:hypothetical protein
MTTTLAAVTPAVEAGASPIRVLYFAEDETFLLLDADAPEDPNDCDQELTVVCAHCLLEHHPQAGRGMDIARRAGEARLRGGAWCSGSA